MLDWIWNWMVCLWLVIIDSNWSSYFYFPFILLKRGDTSASCFPLHPGKVQIPPLGMDNSQMPVSCPGRCWSFGFIGAWYLPSNVAQQFLQKLIPSMTDGLSDWLIDRLPKLLIGWLVAWLSNWWMIDRLTVWLIED